MTNPADKKAAKFGPNKFGPRPCPICAKMSSAQFRPFCSKRCADVDLGRWLKEGYTVPAIEPPDEWSEEIPPEPET